MSLENRREPFTPDLTEESNNPQIEGTADIVAGNKNNPFGRHLNSHLKKI